MTYQEAEAILAKARNGEKKLENNTYLHRVNAESIGIRLHNTDVVILHSDNTATLSSGGWRTVTTKDRINRYTPRDEKYGAHWGVSQKKGAWYVSFYHGNGIHGADVSFADGIVVGADEWDAFYRSGDQLGNIPRVNARLCFAYSPKNE